MPSFALDRDLLALEPGLFRDCGFLGQRLSKSTASISGTTLTASSPDIDFLTSAVAAGHVPLVGGIPCEVVSVSSGTQLVVSRLRESRTGPVLPPPPATSQECVVSTFGPQISLAHGQLLAMAGLDSGGASPGAQALADDAIIRLEAMLALSLVWAAAAALGGEGSAAWARAEWYRARAAAERGRVRMPIDTNGDGVADASRSLALAFTFRG